MRPFVVTLGVLLLASIAVDAAAIWRRHQLEPTERMLLYHNVDDREFHKARLELVGRPRVVLFGSSRVIRLSAAAAHMRPSELYNAGMGAATVEDFIGVWALLRNSGRIPEVAVFCVETWHFDERQPPARWRSLQDEVSGFLDGAAPGSRARWPAVAEATYWWDRATEFVSFTVLRSSIRDLRRARSVTPTPAALAAAMEREARYGQRAVTRDAAFRERVRYNAYAGGGVPVSFRWQASQAEWLRLLWRDMVARGVRVVAYVPPYHPDAWETVRADARYAETLGATVRFLRDSTPRPLERFMDFADPASVPCAEAEFLDSSHPDAECLGRIFGKVTAGVLTP